MENAIISIAKRLGDLRMREILSLYREKKLDIVADKLLGYYDQTYQYSRDKYKKKLTEVKFPGDDSAVNAQIIIEKATQIFG